MLSDIDLRELLLVLRHLNSYYMEQCKSMQKNMKISILNSLGKLKSIFMWSILIVAHKVRKKVLNFIKRSKADFQKHVSVSGSGVPLTQNCVNWFMICENCEAVNIKGHVNREVPKYVNISNSFNNEKVLRLYWDHQRDLLV